HLLLTSFFFTPTPPPTTYTLSLHDALPICALPRQSRGQQTSLLRTDFIPSQRGVHHPATEYCSLEPGFGSAAVSLVAARISRADGSTTLGVGRSSHLRQPALAQFSGPNASRGLRTSRGKTAHRPLR